MPKNKRGGNKAKKGKNTPSISKRPLVVKDKNSKQLYGVVTKKCGGYPPVLEIDCEDGIMRRCVVRGKQRKRVWMEPGNTVLICYNENDTGGEILLKYENSEVRKLIDMGEFTESTFKDNNEEDDSNIVFDYNTVENSDVTVQENISQKNDINLDDI